MSGINLIRLGTSPSGASYFIGLISGGASQVGSSLAIDSSDNMYICGSSINNSVDNSFEVMKLTSSGAISWQRQLGNTGSGAEDYGAGIVVDSSGNTYAVGYSTTSGILYLQLTKYNSSGAIQWQVKLGNGSQDASGYSIALDSANSFLYVAGKTASNKSFAAKYNLSGVLQWQEDLGGNPALYGVALDSSGNVYVTGSLTGVSAQFTTIKLNSSGAIQWQTRFGNNSSGRGITLDSSSNVFVAGEAGSSGLIGKYNSSGVLQWARQLSNGGLNAITFYSVTLDSAGNIYVCGDSDNNRVVIAKYDSAGTISWQRQITNATVGTQNAYSIKVNSLGNICVFGSSTGSISGPKMFLLCVLPPDGSKTGTYTVSGYSFIYAANVLTDAAYSVTGTPTWTATATTLTASTTTLSESASSLTSTVTTI
jgi:hypothetical protein